MWYTTRIVTAFLAVFSIGILIYGWFNNWIIIAYQPCRTTHQQHVPIDTQTITVVYQPPYHTTHQYEERTIIATDSEAERAERILQQWLSVLDESYTLYQPCHVQSVTPSPTGHLLYVSFDQAPCNPQDPAYIKWCMFETALASLRNNGITADNIHFLVHHQPISDYHLDFTHPWPIIGFSELCQDITLTEHTTPQKDQHVTLVLDPAGDAEYPGRQIAGCFERGIALQCCQQLQQRIQTLMPQVHVMLSRSAGEYRDPLQSAAFANRVNADLCISLHFYYTEYTHPHSYVYYYARHPQTDFWHPTHKLTLYPHHQAHIPFIQHSHNIAHILAHQLTNCLGSHMAIGPIVGLPFAPLCGMHVPAIALEVGMRTDDEWQAYLNDWTTSFCNTIMHLAKAK